MPVITVARQFGAGGSSVAAIVARRIGADVVDKSLISELARRLEVPVREIEAEDERPTGFIERLSESFAPLAGGLGMAWDPPYPDPAYDPRHVVVSLTRQVIREAALSGNVVIVGRGGSFVLRDHQGALHVFLRASEEVRIATAMARLSLDEAHARRRLHETDANRAAYMRQLFGQDWQAPSHYDLVLDTGRLGYELAAEIVVLAASMRPASGESGAAPDAESPPASPVRHGR